MDGTEHRILPVASLDDPRIASYRNVKDRELSRLAGRFLVEGELIVRRLLASGFAVESVLVTKRRASGVAGFVPPDVPVYAAPARVVSAIVGFPL